MLKRLLITSLVVGAMALGYSTAASAHAELTGTDPEDGAELDEAPAEVTLEFNEELDGPSTEIAVTDPEGDTLDLDDPEFDGNAFTQPMHYNEAGEYTLAYRILSQDGHRVEDTLTFTVDDVPADLSLLPDEEPAEEEEVEETDEVADAETTDAAEEATDDEDDGGGAPVGAFIIGILAVIIVGVLLVKLLNRNKATYTDDSDNDTDATDKTPQ